MDEKGDLTFRDTALSFPHLMILRASAGSGKTHALTKRYVQFILSEAVPSNQSWNILAVTFSNNAAKEMKGRILTWLKDACLGDAAVIEELGETISLPPDGIREKACRMIDAMLGTYADFQVRTIDSLMASVFRASVLDFGYPPEFEILMQDTPLAGYAFDLFLRDVREGTEKAALFEDIAALVRAQEGEDGSYKWDIAALIRDEVMKAAQKLDAWGAEPLIEDLSAESEAIGRELHEVMEAIDAGTRGTGLSENSRSTFRPLLALVRQGRFSGLVGRGMKLPPVKKPSKGQEDQTMAYERVIRLWEEAGRLAGAYRDLTVRTSYIPVLKALAAFSPLLEKVKRQQATLSIGDINARLAGYLREDVVPDVYFRLGERVMHFLIDEFQDTSPVQWRNLLPLIENSLAGRGSLFVVGDTKQAIYGFRNADYAIMKQLASPETCPISSASPVEGNLSVNYRSLPQVLRFSDTLFRGLLPRTGYREAGAQSGLLDYEQSPRSSSGDGGYARLVLFERNDDEPPERQEIIRIIGRLTAKGFSRSEIAVLVRKNEHARTVSAWINEAGIPFISLSSLDVRSRKVTGELISILSFLDSPTDDLAFASFLLGETFRAALDAGGHGLSEEDIRAFLFRTRDRRPLYGAFQEEFPGVWEAYFEGLFRASGYLPLYDLICMIYGTFKVFGLRRDEEAALVKLLEVVKECEGSGSNSLRDFLDITKDEDEGQQRWDMAVPKGTDAVTVMTVHKAKGLGFPAVIVLLYEEQGIRLDAVADVKHGKARLLKLTKDLCGESEAFGTLFSQEVLKEQVNRLNALYVALTRAREELYVIGVGGKKFPIDLLREMDWPEPEERARGPRESAGAAESAWPLHTAGVPDLPPAAPRMISLHERRRGEVIHRVLQKIMYLSGDGTDLIGEAARAVLLETRQEFPEQELTATVSAIVSLDPVRSFFEKRPNRSVATEREVVDGEGRLFRIDRMIVDPAVVTVIDWKTGGPDDSDRHFAQMIRYLDIIRPLYPGKSVQGFLVYPAEHRVKKVG